MQIEIVKEKYAGRINTLEIGTLSAAVKIGGETTLPFLLNEGAMPNPPLVALEVLDSEKDPVKLARSYVNDLGAKILCARLQSVHEDWGNREPGEAVAVLKNIKKAAGVPLIVIGCGDDDKDSELLPKASQALKGGNCLFGIATQDHYKTLTATCLADGHSIIAESPIDINIAKQLNILISDMGFDPKRIAMHPTTTSLGYGMEYVYSIMERGRLAAFMGDAMLSMPFILFTGQEVWRTKEANDGREQGINWEVGTAVAMLQAGADLIVMRDPDAAGTVTKYIEEMTK